MRLLCPSVNMVCCIASTPQKMTVQCGVVISMIAPIHNATDHVLGKILYVKEVRETEAIAVYRILPTIHSLHINIYRTNITRLFKKHQKIIEYTSEDFKHTSEDFEHTSQDFEQTYITRSWIYITRFRSYIARFWIYTVHHKIF